MTSVYPPSHAPKSPPFQREMRAYFDRIAPELPRWQRRNRYYYRDLERLHQFLIPPQSRVLEIGCGLGDLLGAVQPEVGVGIDFSESMVQLARPNHPQLHFYNLDAETLHPQQFPLSSGSLTTLSWRES
jgi:ubiquinone/menaquinone biosynthesis C-methylase UbiE